MYDLIVAGGGPAGLATALYADRVGLRTVVLDPRPGPIDKACGEGLMPGAVRALEALDVELRGQEIRGIRYADRAQQVDAAFRTGRGLGVRRTDLHAALSETLAARGIPVVSRSVGAVEQDADSVHAGGLTGRYLAAADGLHSPIRRQLGLDRPLPSGRGQRWGQRRHFAVTPWTDVVEVHWSRNAEAYVTPVAANLIGVAVLSSIRASFDDLLAGFPSVAGRLPGTAATAVRGAGPLRQRARRRVAGRVLLVGDAAGYVDALTGEGIAVGLSCAEQLVACVAAGDPHRYERQWLRASRRYRMITSSLLWARRRPYLGRAIVPAAVHAPRVFAAAVHQIAQ